MPYNATECRTAAREEHKVSEVEAQALVSEGDFKVEFHFGQAEAIRLGATAVCPASKNLAGNIPKKDTVGIWEGLLFEEEQPQCFGA